MATTSDMYELPCCIGTAREVAAFIGVTIDSFYSMISKKMFSSNHGGYHVYKVEVGECTDT